MFSGESVPDRSSLFLQGTHLIIAAPCEPIGVQAPPEADSEHKKPNELIIPWENET
jgi:hypothetical protein